MWDAGRNAIIKMQERRIQELERAIEEMERRDEAVLRMLKDATKDGNTDEYEIDTMMRLLAPMEKDRKREIWREGTECSVWASGKGRWWQESQSREIDNEIDRQMMRLINQLYEYLQGELPKGVTCFVPKLSKDNAFSVIWFLQEVIGCLPSKYEKCSECDEIYNSEAEGHYSELNGKSYCGGCWEDGAPVTLCWDCGADVFSEESWSEEYNEYLCDQCKKERERK
jgi:hypothetical protein